MSDIKAKIAALNEIVDELETAESLYERAALFAASRTLIGDLLSDERLNGYAKEKAVELRWHIGAALGFDETNGQTPEQHRVWAMGSLGTLESVFDNVPHVDSLTELQRFQDVQSGINEGLLRVTQSLSVALINLCTLEEAGVIQDLLASISANADNAEFLGSDGIEAFKEVVAETMNTITEAANAKRTG